LSNRLKNERILLTGGSGFLGSHLLERLKQAGYLNIAAPTHREYDLTLPDAVERIFTLHRPEVVIHAAGVVGGIGANKAEPGRFFFENAMMGMQLIDAARRHSVKKTVVLGTICAYPKFTPVPFSEDALWNGYPEETNAPYGIAKKALLVQCQAYRQQYGMNVVYLMPVNLYGPGDNFAPGTSHVIPAMICKCLEAVENRSTRIVLWGDGSPTREFLYVKDAADGIVAAAQLYDKPEPVNLGSGSEISIRELAHTIAELTGFRCEIEWDTSKPNGQPRRCVDTTRAEREFGFRARTPLYEGLRETIAWYAASRTQLGKPLA
jgi:GDP-L-fucose synthase